MPQKERPVRLELREHNSRVDCAREIGKARFGKPEQFAIGEYSWLPRSAFYLIQHAISNRLKSVDVGDKQEFEPVRAKIQNGLASAAKKCHCVYDWKAETGRMLWKTGQRGKPPVIAFIIVDFSRHHDKFEYKGKGGLVRLAEYIRRKRREVRRLERHSRAILRIAIVVLKHANGKFLLPKITVCRTLPKEKRHE